jgi:anti-sigma factor RsiW
MKSCLTNRKRIAWLAVNALDAREAGDLRAHLETCEACRRYREEISNVTAQLTPSDAGPEFQASESFHQKVVRRLRAEQSESFSSTVAARLRAMVLNWRLVLPVIGATAVLIVAWSMSHLRPGVPSPAPTVALATLAPHTKNDPAPTLSNYQVVANRSLEELDELLTRQGNRNPWPTPLYTASTVPNANASD